MIDRKELRKSERIKTMGMSHLITAKTITSLEPKLSGEVGRGRPLQLCCLTYFAKIKSKRIIAEKRPKFNKKSTLEWLVSRSTYWTTQIYFRGVRRNRLPKKMSEYPHPGIILEYVHFFH